MSTVNSAAGSSTGRHAVFRGIRTRGGKWVSEIREPRKTNRIWLGTFPTPEMAATAYDVAALALRGNDAVLNFPDMAPHYPKPASASPSDIRSAATSFAAAAEEQRKKKAIEVEEALDFEYAGGFEEEFVLYDMHNLMIDMAGGEMMVSPHGMGLAWPDDDGSPESILGGDRLWNYD